MSTKAKINIVCIFIKDSIGHIAHLVELLELYDLKDDVLQDVFGIPLVFIQLLLTPIKHHWQNWNADCEPGLIARPH